MLLGLVFLAWYEIFKTRERVIIHCQRVCKEARLQMLDQTVSVSAFRLAINRGIIPDLVRTYRFEYSISGDERLPGYVDMVNNRISSVRFTGPEGETIYHH